MFRLKFQCVSVFVVIFLVNSAAAEPHKIQCLDQKSTECYILSTYLSENQSDFHIISQNAQNVMTITFESSVIPRLTKDVCSVFPNLRRIDAKKVGIMVVEEDAFVACVSLDHITLSFNNISYLYKNTFNRNTNLKEINLNGNALTELHEDTFKGLTHLSKLRLSQNELQEIPSALFRDLGNLDDLALHQNYLTDIDSLQLAKNCPKLQYIHLRDNHFRCDRLRVIVDDLTMANVTFRDYVFGGPRARNYTADVIGATECLNEEQFEMEMKNRKTLNKKVVELERELIDLTTFVEREGKLETHIYIIIVVSTLLLLLGIAVGFVLAKKGRNHRRMERLNERMEINGVDFTHQPL